MSDNRLANISPGLGSLLNRQAQTILLMIETKDNLELEMSEHLEKCREQLIKKHSVKSKINRWLNEQVDVEERKFVEANRFTFHSKAIEKCRDLKFKQEAYFIEKEMKFIKEVRFIF